MQAPVVADTKVADLSATGGTGAITYTLEGQSKNFKVEGSEVKTAKQIDGEVTESITVKATDTKGKTKNATKEIKITASEAV